MFDICVFAGRFRPYHNGHKLVVEEALKNAQYVFLLVGSCDDAINFRNPFSFEEVREMIRASLTPRDADRVFILPMVDRDNDIKWVTDVQTSVKKQIDRLSLGDNPSVALIGYQKDGSSYYLKLFPQWSSIGVEPVAMLDATALRNALYTSDNPPSTLLDMWQDGRGDIPHGTYLLLREWIHTDRFLRMRAEYEFMRDYLGQFSQTPYPRYFTAADACVIQSGHVLLVRRGAMPGEGLWALRAGMSGRTNRSARPRSANCSKRRRWTSTTRCSTGPSGANCCSTIRGARPASAPSPSPMASN